MEKSRDSFTIVSRDGVLIPGFSFSRPSTRRVLMEVPKVINEATPKTKGKKRVQAIIPHVNTRTGEGWPRVPGKHRRWTGWLTYREYNLIEFCKRFQCNDIFDIGTSMKLKQNSIERMYHSMVEVGIIQEESSPNDFVITPDGMLLFTMTDEFILSLDLGEE
jgi:hypothetical protein